MAIPVVKIPGIGLHSADQLKQNGYTSVEDLAAATIESLAKVHGFGPARAKTIIETAKEIMDTSAKEDKKVSKKKTSKTKKDTAGKDKKKKTKAEKKKVKKKKKDKKDKTSGKKKKKKAKTSKKDKKSTSTKKKKK